MSKQTCFEGVCKQTAVRIINLLRDSGSHTGAKSLFFYPTDEINEAEIRLLHIRLPILSMECLKTVTNETSSTT